MIAQKADFPNREATINTLKELCANNSEYFSNDNSENGQRLYMSCMAMIEISESIKIKTGYIETKVASFDFDENTPGNGYRSFIKVVDLALKLALTALERVTDRRDSLLFRKTTITKDVESCSHLLTSIEGCLNQLESHLCWSDPGDLFVRDDCPLHELLAKYGEINQHCFYGRNLGFQFCDSIKNLLQFISLSMALFSEVYYSQGSLLQKATNSAMSSAKFLTDPELRARRIVNLGQNAEVDFCKAFWFLSETELLNQLPSIVAPSVAVSKIIQLPPEPLVAKTTEGEEIDVPVPASFIGRKSVQVRLISHKIRTGMIGTKGKGGEPPSKGLLFHCHGGGFVAQSSKSHDGYLRDWAKELDVPILCVDYSLAPEAPYPRALEEIFYAYCWARKHFSLLGSTGEVIVAAGDSAGANLLLSTTLKCAKLKIPVFTGLFVAYAPTLVHYTPSPSRLLCMMDSLIPFGFLMRCLKAYAVPDPNVKQFASNSDADNSDTESFEEISESDLMELRAQRSPVSEQSDTLTYESLNSEDEPEGSSKMKGQMKELLESCSRAGSDSEADRKTTESLQTKFTSIISNFRESFSKYLIVGDRGRASEATKLLDLDVDPKSSFMDKFSFDVPKDPFLSPLLAADEDLKKFPPTRVLSVQMDPCLDDCIMFARRLKTIGNNVQVDVLEGLPHGFLNFSLFSKEAYDGSKVCIKRIDELLNKIKQ
ncbi:unnamed protein product [Phyllotreta striolata]|uniref:Hormone-sensitive lipase n=1 Tax=Phyllotreta striolata TaxID=444603 RepID=A0A9N9TMW8_PHYSR|nr:unnamed protein product [Phyllotreta striolata]